MGRRLWKILLIFQSTQLAQNNITTAIWVALAEAAAVVLKNCMTIAFTQEK